MQRLGLPLVRWRSRSFGHREVFEPGGADRLDTYFTGGTRVLGAFPAQAVVDRRDHPCGDKHGDKLNVPDDLEVLRLNFWGDASHLAIYDSCVRFRSVKLCRDFQAEV